LAYLEDGYSQIEIANHLRLSKSAVSMVIKNGKNGDLMVEINFYLQYQEISDIRRGLLRYSKIV